jgi:hypothetical protein
MSQFLSLLLALITKGCEMPPGSFPLDFNSEISRFHPLRYSNFSTNPKTMLKKAQVVSRAGFKIELNLKWN